MIAFIFERSNLSILGKQNIDAPATLKENLNALFPKFDPKTMQYGWNDHAFIPDYFSLDKEHKVVELPPSGKVVFNGRSIRLGYKMNKAGKMVARTINNLISNGELVLDDPFEYLLRNNKLATRSLEQVMQQQALQNIKACQNYLQRIEISQEEEELNAYSLYKQLSYTKAYLNWTQNEKTSTNLKDARRLRYLEMEAQLEKIRQKYQPMVRYAEDCLAELSGSATVSTQNTKSEIKAYLTAQGLSYPAKASKTQLLQIIKNSK